MKIPDFILIPTKSVLLGSIVMISFSSTLLYSYSESNSDEQTIENEHIEPESLEYFTNDGYQIHSFFDKYGLYHVPYKGANISVTDFEYDFGIISTKITAENNSNITFVIPNLIIHRPQPYSSDLPDLFLLINGIESLHSTTNKDNAVYVNFEINSTAYEVEIISSSIPEYIVAEPYSHFSLKTTNSIYFSLFPPLKQINNGVPYDEILCNNNYHVMSKSSSDYTVCVKIDSINKLIERGWRVVTS